MIHFNAISFISFGSEQIQEKNFRYCKDLLLIKMVFLLSKHDILQTFETLLPFYYLYFNFNFYFAFVFGI